MATVMMLMVSVFKRPMLAWLFMYHKLIDHKELQIQRELRMIIKTHSILN